MKEEQETAEEQNEEEKPNKASSTVEVKPDYAANVQVGRNVKRNRPECGDFGAADDGSNPQDDSEFNDQENDEDTGKDHGSKFNRKSELLVDDDFRDVVFLGLRVYTSREAPAVVNGQLRHEMATMFTGITIDDSLQSQSLVFL